MRVQLLIPILKQGSYPACRLKPVQMKWFFYISTVILLFLAGGLMMTGVHEFQQVSCPAGPFHKAFYLLLDFALTKEYERTAENVAKPAIRAGTKF